MSTVRREAIYAALFALVAQTPGLTSWQRKYIPVTKIDAPVAPLLCQVQGAQDGVWKGPQLGVPWTLAADLIVYVHADNCAPDPPIVRLNQILDDLELLVQGNLRGGEQTLGGLVQHCRMVGHVEVYESIESPIAFAIVPITMTATPAL